MQNHLIVNRNCVEDISRQEEKVLGRRELKHNTHMQAESLQEQR